MLGGGGLLGVSASEVAKVVVGLRAIGEPDDIEDLDAGTLAYRVPRLVGNLEVGTKTAVIVFWRVSRRARIALKERRFSGSMASGLLRVGRISLEIMGLRARIESARPVRAGLPPRP